MADATALPECDLTDPAQLAAWYSGFAFAEAYRKVVLAQTREIVRAKYELAKTKITEARLDDLARSHDIYLSFLLTHLQGRTAYEKMARERMGL